MALILTPRRRACSSVARLLLLSAAGVVAACQPDSSGGTVDNWPPIPGTTIYDAGYYDGSFYDSGFIVGPNGQVVPVVIVTNDSGVVVAVPITDGGLDYDAAWAVPDAQLPLPPDAAAADSSVADAGHADAETAPDAAVVDSGASDSGTVDSGTFDAGVDAGAMDAGPTDSGTPPVDAGKPDAGAVDAGKPDAGPVDAGTKPSITSCTMSATTVAPTVGSHRPNYGAALFVTNASGQLVKKFAVYSTNNNTRPAQYYRAVTGVSGVDATTSATLQATKSFNFTWDLKNPSGALVPDGSYTFQTETHSDQGDRVLAVPFTKSATPVNATVADGNGVSAARVVCQ